MLHPSLIAVFGSLLISGISVGGLGGNRDPRDPSAQEDQNPPPSTRKVAIDGSSLGGFVLPILPVQHDLEIDAGKVNDWTVDDT